MSVCGPQREAESPLFEGVSVDAESETPGQGHKEAVFPVPVQAHEPFSDLSGPHLQAFGQECIQPAVQDERRELGDDAVAPWQQFFAFQFAVASGQVGRKCDLQLGYRFSPAVAHSGVCL